MIMDKNYCFGCHDDLGEATGMPDLSGLRLWTWQLDQAIEDEVARIDAIPLLAWYPSIPFFPTQDLSFFQDDVCNLFDEDDRFCEGIKLEKEEKVNINDIKAFDGKNEKAEITKRSNNIDVDDQMRRPREDNIRIITFEEVSRYFYMPISQAAKELNIGLTLLKKKCRELGIPRWPHRKMKSLQTLINNVQELGREEGETGEAQLRSAIEILEQERKMMEKVPSVQLEEKTKRLRQACFKANYKKRRLMALAATTNLN